MHFSPFPFLYRVLPVLVLSVIAGGVYWLARMNEIGQLQTTDVVQAPRHIPEYIMRNFSGSMLNPQGEARYRIQGEILVRYEDDHSYEITRPALRLFRPEHPEVTVTSRFGKMDAHIAEIDLLGNANLVRAAIQGASPSPEIRAHAEAFHVFVDEEIVVTDVPVDLRQGRSIIAADGMTYPHLERFLEFRGNVTSTLFLRK